MPVQQILTQPDTNSLNAAYSPIVLRVQATSTTNYPEPPVVYCDIYVDGKFYRTLSKSQSDQLNDTNSEWQFDIQDVQEVFTKYIAPNGGMAILKPSGLHALVFCRFRSSYLDDNNIIQPDPDVPIQSTGSTDAVDGTGLQSNTFVVLNATLQHQDNPDLQTHLNAYKKGTWDAQAFPLSHRPDNYVIGRNDSDYFPFIYSGSKSVRCLKVILHKNDGTQQLLAYCAPPEPCLLIVSNLRIIKAPDEGDGRTYYYAIFAINDTNDHYKLEISYNNGATWQDITIDQNYHTSIAYSTWHYNAMPDGSPASHSVRVTPYCDNTNLTPGTPAIAGYTVPVCPTISNLTLTYNPQTQQLTYGFIDPNNLQQSVQLWKDGVEFATVRADAPDSGSWTITASGTYYITVETPCTVGTPITETSNSIDVVVQNIVCNAPFNVSVNFTADGSSLHATWQVGDSTYTDFVKWYDADTNVLLLAGNVQAGVFAATISVASYPNIQRFYCTVQHQCPSPSILGQSNTVQRDNTFSLVLDYTTDPTTVTVKCMRYGQLAPAPFTVLVNIASHYTSGGGSPISNTASNYLVKGNTTGYIYGSSGIVITEATITSISPTTQGGLTYTF